MTSASSSSAAKPASQIPLKFPAKWPYAARDFDRRDMHPDEEFYADPRFVHHIDDNARAALTAYFQQAFESQLSWKSNGTADSKAGNEQCKLDALDVCSSWVCHWPTALKSRMGRTAGIGMNMDELARNEALQEVGVVDLNDDSDGGPKLPLKDDSFDVITLTVSVDYLIHPLAVFKELFRVLRPGGLCILSFSNRLFPTKAIMMWLRSDDYTHVEISANYFRFSADWCDIQAFDISPSANTDPLFIVQARKPASNLERKPGDLSSADAKTGGSAAASGSNASNATSVVLEATAVHSTPSSSGSSSSAPTTAVSAAGASSSASEQLNAPVSNL